MFFAALLLAQARLPTIESQREEILGTISLVTKLGMDQAVGTYDVDNQSDETL